MEAVVPRFGALGVGIADSFLRAHVLRLCKTASSFIPRRVVAIDLILVDAQGDRVHGSVDPAEIDRYLDTFEEGVEYILSRFLVVPDLGDVVLSSNPNQVLLSFESVVFRSQSVLIDPHSLRVVDSEAVLAHRFACRVLADVVGVVVSVRYEDVCSNGCPMRDRVAITLVDDRGIFDCFLAGDLVVEFQSMFREPYLDLPTVVLQFGRIVKGNGGVGVHGVSRLFMNPMIEEVFTLRARMFAEGVLQGLRRRVAAPYCIVPYRFQFRGVYPARSLFDLTGGIGDGPYVVCAMLNGLSRVGAHTSRVCSCNDLLVSRPLGYFCTSCHIYPDEVVPRKKLRVGVSDGVIRGGFRMFDNVLDGLGCLNRQGCDYALSAGGVGVLRDMCVLMMIKKQTVNVGFSRRFYYVVAITDDARTIQQFKIDFPHCVRNSLIAAVESLGSLGGFNLALSDFTVGHGAGVVVTDPVAV